MTEGVRTLYDVVKEKLYKADRQTYLHRIIYIGVHHFTRQPTVEKFFEDIVIQVNDQELDEFLTGFLLYYEEHFIHVVEGSQGTILRHLRRIFTALSMGTASLETMKVLIACHNIKQRFFKQWIALRARPSVLIEDITIEDDKEGTWRPIKSCITKMYKLAAFIYEKQERTDLYCLASDLPLQSKNIPEVRLISFILTSKVLMDLKDYADAYFYICKRKSYHELIWPPLEDLVPYNILTQEESLFLCDRITLNEDVQPDTNLKTKSVRV
ncbi:hypothetical protein L9F63_013983 [Diploptera punctata]|uniref:BLUF domain-containing protein n=1 Tax=Diploptera punctata TaxID=6984 RepID=A0AAD8A919_DIPPU|nr:hypothetical protein L9F63_013983 [Diploptera punctata]